MAKGKNAQKNGRLGDEWWGKRPLTSTPISRNKGMKFWKRLLHKIERRKNKVKPEDYE